MTNDQHASVRDTVRDHYAKISQPESGSCCAPGCCGAKPEASRELGYSEAELAALPEGSNLGLGCGNPQAIAALRPGDRVLDLGSGGGIDSFLAARSVGPSGHVIGVDMTSEMLKRARHAAARLGLDNVEFRLGEIEHLPVAEADIDVILSNCVINLSPDKAQVFRESFRVLKPGGRLAISDVVAIAPIPTALKEQAAALSGCVSGATEVETIEALLSDAGFTDIQVQVRPESREFIKDWFPGSGVEQCVASASITATKPSPTCRETGCCSS